MTSQTVLWTLIAWLAVATLVGFACAWLIQYWRMQEGIALANSLENELRRLRAMVNRGETGGATAADYETLVSSALASERAVHEREMRRVAAERDAAAREQAYWRSEAGRLALAEGALVDERSLWQAESARLTAALKTAQDERERSQAAHERLGQEQQELQDTLGRVRGELAQAQQSLQEKLGWGEQLKRLTGEVGTLSEERATLLSRQQTLQDAHATLATEHAELSRQHAAARAGFEAEISRLRDDHVGQVDALRGEHAREVEAMRTEGADGIAAQRSELERAAEASLAAARVQAQQELDARVAQWQADRQGLEDQLAALKAEHDARLADAAAAATHQAETVAALQAELDALRGEHEQQRDQLSRVSAQHQQLEQAHAHLRGEHSLLQAELGTSRDLVSELVARSERARDEIGEREDAFAAVQAHNQQLAAELRAAETSLSRQHQDLAEQAQAHADALAAERALALEAQQNLQTEISTLRTSLDTAKEQVAAALNKGEPADPVILERLGQQRQQELEALLARAQRQLAEQKMETTGLKGRVKDLEYRLSQLWAQVEAPAATGRTHPDGAAPLQVSVAESPELHLPAA